VRADRKVNPERVAFAATRSCVYALRAAIPFVPSIGMVWEASFAMDRKR
jgi:hypothetical protein